MQSRERLFYQMLQQKVSINGIEYTVAEAIEMKNHGVEFDEKMLTALKKKAI